MECKRVVILLTMVVVMAMGNFLNHTEAQKIPFPMCFGACFQTCKAGSKFHKIPMCLITCSKSCLQPSSPQSLSPNKIDDVNYFCKLGCATHHCVSFSSYQNPNVEEVSGCVDTCSNKCN